MRVRACVRARVRACFTHACTHTQEVYFDRATSTRFILDNANAGDTINFESHNSESSYEKRVTSVLEPSATRM